MLNLDNCNETFAVLVILNAQLIKGYLKQGEGLKKKGVEITCYYCWGLKALEG